MMAWIDSILPVESRSIGSFAFSCSSFALFCVNALDLVLIALWFGRWWGDSIPAGYTVMGTPFAIDDQEAGAFAPGRCLRISAAIAGKKFAGPRSGSSTCNAFPRLRDPPAGGFQPLP